MSSTYKYPVKYSIIVFFLKLCYLQGNIKRSDAQNVPRNRTNSVSSITSGSSLGSSDMSSSHSPSSNEGIHPPRRALLQDRSR